SGKGRVHALRRFAETRTMKTGTTIAGVVFEGGVVVGADTRATGGKTVCDRNCDKIHILASNIACCGAGTSADADRATEGVRIALLRMASEIQACLPSMTAHPTRHGHNGKSIITRNSNLDEVQRGCLRVSAAAYLLKRHLFRHQGTISAALVLGGVDAVGTHLYQIHEGGSLAEVDFAAMGSGSLAALSALEGGYRRGLTEEDAKELVASAISTGITNDLGSGSNVDLCVITADRGLEHHRGVRTDSGIEGHDATVASSVVGERVRLNGDIFTADVSTVKAQGETHDRCRSEQLTNLPATAEGYGTGLYGKDNDIGGEGGSRAWVGSVRRRGKEKRVVRVDLESAKLKEFQCSALDDKIEVL
ncbi:unnamed protein product, partial [Ascophyllum nodosum]